MAAQQIGDNELNSIYIKRNFNKLEIIPIVNKITKLRWRQMYQKTQIKQG